MRKLMLWAFVANLVLLLISLRILPEVVAVHFSGAGWPDAWTSKGFNALLVLLIETALLVMVLSVPRLSLGLGAKWAGQGRSGCCANREACVELKKRFARLMHEFGLVLFVLLFFVGLLTLAANLSDPVRLNEPLLLAGLAVYLLYVCYWVVKLVRHLRLCR
ncbi:MAG: DUF1648 domain-containing protein [Gammaproteobacteria bacterium]|jgi:uncharacterized membrane protein